MDDIVATSDRIYRLVLNVYPRAFRDEYGEEMAQAMRDQVRDAWVEGRVLGVTALWLKVLLDTARSAITGHLMQGRTVSFSRRGLGYGLATAIGYPLVFVSFVAWSGELVGFETAENWLAHRRYLYPVFAGPGFVLAGIGLRALYQRLEVSEPLAIRGVRLGVALGLAGIAGIIAGLGGREDYFAGFTIPAALVLFTFGLANMGRIAWHMVPVSSPSALGRIPQCLSDVLYPRPRRPLVHRRRTPMGRPSRKHRRCPGCPRGQANQQLIQGSPKGAE
jgi:hypothetical protein